MIHTPLLQTPFSILLFSWSRQWDSNPRPAVYKTATLTPELQRHIQLYVLGFSCKATGHFFKQPQHKYFFLYCIRPVNSFESRKSMLIKEFLKNFVPVLNNVIEYVAAQAGEWDLDRTWWWFLLRKHYFLRCDSFQLHSPLHQSNGRVQSSTLRASHQYLCHTTKASTSNDIRSQSNDDHCVFAPRILQRRFSIFSSCRPEKPSCQQYVHQKNIKQQEKQHDSS